MGVQCTSLPRRPLHARSGTGWDLTASRVQRVRVTRLGGIDKSAAVLRNGARARCGTSGCLTGMAGIDMAGTAAVADASHSTVAAAAAVAITIGIEDDVWGSGEALTSGSSRWQMWMLTHQENLNLTF